mgnify:CR=1 FL=1
MYEFIRIQFLLGNISAGQVNAFVPKYITQQQADAITAAWGGA